MDSFTDLEELNLFLIQSSQVALSLQRKTPSESELKGSRAAAG